MGAPQLPRSLSLICALPTSLRRGLFAFLKTALVLCRRIRFASPPIAMRSSMSQSSDKLEYMREVALSCLNVPYIWGGNNPLSGMDCSGFAQWCLQSVGMDPKGDQTAQALYRAFIEKGLVGQKGLGALAFYGRSLTSISHVALMLNDWQVIEAGGGGSRCKTPEIAAQKGAMVRIRPLLARSDLRVVIMPLYDQN